MRTLAAVSITACVWAGAAGSVDARVPALKRFDNGTGRAVSDRARYVAYKTSATNLRLWDTKTDKRRDVAVDDGCAVRDADNGLVFLECGQTFRTYVLVSAATGTAQVPPAPQDSFVEYIFVGRYWLGGTNCQGHCGPAYLNWRTGERRTSDHRLDVNTPDLRNYDPRHYPALLGSYPNLYFRPAGLHSRRTRVRKCLSKCVDATVLNGRVAWREWRKAYGLILKGRRLCRWGVPRPSDAASVGGIELLPTNYAMVASVETRTSGFGRAIYQAPWRDC
jgi:hypothetical protein